MESQDLLANAVDPPGHDLVQIQARYASTVVLGELSVLFEQVEELKPPSYGSGTGALRRLHGERGHQDPVRRDPVDEDELEDPVGQAGRLAGAGPGDEQWAIGGLLHPSPHAARHR